MRVYSVSKKEEKLAWRDKWNDNMTKLLDDYESAVGENNIDKMELIYKKMAFLEKFKKSMLTDSIEPNDDDEGKTKEEKLLNNINPGEEF